MNRYSHPSRQATDIVVLALFTYLFLLALIVVPVVLLVVWLDSKGW